jgi:uncharacterized protein YqgV (UPF0045/DUF77 family)
MRRLVWLPVIFLLLPWSACAVTRDDARDSYVEKANRQLQEWNVKVDELQKRVEKAGTSTRVELDQALRAVRENLDIFRRKVTEVQGSGESSWKSLRRGADAAFKDVKHAYRKATSSLDKDKQKGKP